MKTRFGTVAIVSILALRLLAALFIAPPVVADAAGYEASALRLATVGTYAFPTWDSGVWEIGPEGHVIPQQGYDQFLEAEPNAWLMPGYAAILAPFAWLLGIGPVFEVVIRFLQAIASIATVWLMYLIARDFSPRAGRFALILGALYPPMILANLYLVTETFFTLSVTATLYLLHRWLHTRRWTHAAAIGLVMAAGMYIKPTYSVWALIAAAIILVSSYNRADAWRTIRHLLLAGLIAAVCLSPWWVRNYNLYDRFVPFGTWGAATQLDGIRADAAGERVMPWEEVAGPGVPTDSALVERVAELDGAGLSPEEYAVAAKSLVGEEWRDRFGPTLQRRFRSSVAAAIQPFSIPQTVMGGLPYRLATGMHALLLALFGFGIVLMPKLLRGEGTLDHRDHALNRLSSICAPAEGEGEPLLESFEDRYRVARPDDLPSHHALAATMAWLLATTSIYFFAISSIVFPQTRYAFPGMAALIAVGAIGFDELLTRLRQPHV